MPWVLLQASENNIDWPEAVIAVAGIALVSIIVTIAIVQIFGTWRSRASVAREEAYRGLAEQSVFNQGQLADRGEQMSASLDDIRERLAGIEKVLKDVG